MPCLCVNRGEATRSYGGSHHLAMATTSPWLPPRRGYRVASGQTKKSLEETMFIMTAVRSNEELFQKLKAE